MKVSLLLLTLIVPWMLKAQEGPQSLSLQQAIEFAIKYNKELKASKMDINLYREKIRESVSEGLPQVNGTLDYSSNFGYKMNFGGNSMKLKDQSNLKVGVSQLLFNGQWIVGIQTSKIAQRLASQQVDITELDIVENIYNSYYTVLVSERLCNILRQNMENMNKIYEHTANQLKAGTVEETDLDQIRINVGQLKNNLLAMERTVAVNYNLLRIQLGLEAGTEITLTDTLEQFLNEETANSLYSQEFDINNNLEYRLQNTQTELNKKTVSLQKWSFAPTISGSYNYTYKIKKAGFDMSPNHSAGLTMSIPVFSGLKRYSQVQQAKIELEKSIVNQDLLKDNLHLQDEQLKYDLKNAMENYALQKENIDVAARVLRNYQIKYEHGAISSLDLTNANDNYLTAESNYTNAILTLLQAQVSIERLYNQLKH